MLAGVIFSVIFNIISGIIPIAKSREVVYIQDASEFFYQKFRYRLKHRENIRNLQHQLPMTTTTPSPATTLRLLLGDQLNTHHSWFGAVQSDIVYCMIEMRQETDYATHHVQKIVAFFAAMRAFAAHVEQCGHRVCYVRLDDVENPQTLHEAVLMLLARYGCTAFEYQLPDEFRLDEQLTALAAECAARGVESRAYDTEHF